MYEAPEYWVGKTVSCTKQTSFVDGTSHEKGDTVVVTEETAHYFSLFSLPRGVSASMLLYRDLEKIRYVEVNHV